MKRSTKLETEQRTQKFRSSSHPLSSKDSLLAIDSGLLKDVEVVLEVKLGEVVMPIGEVLQLQAGSVMKLGSALNEPVEIFLNGALVARGEIVALDEHFAVRVLEVAKR